MAGLWLLLASPAAGEAGTTARTLLTQASYLAASVFFILGLKSLTKADTARRSSSRSSSTSGSSPAW